MSIPPNNGNNGNAIHSHVGRITRDDWCEKGDISLGNTLRIQWSKSHKITFPCLETTAVTRETSIDSSASKFEVNADEQYDYLAREMRSVHRKFHLL